MTPDEIATAFGELVGNEEFLAFCNCWQEDGHCPFPLVDWLQDRGLMGAADAAKWCVNMHERRIHGDSIRSRVMPFANRFFGVDGKHKFFRATGRELTCDETPFEAWSRSSYDGHGYGRFPVVIAHFLLNVDAAILNRDCPPKPETCVI